MNIYAVNLGHLIDWLQDTKETGRMSTTLARLDAMLAILEADTFYPDLDREDTMESLLSGNSSISMRRDSAIETLCDILHEDLKARLEEAFEATK